MRKSYTLPTEPISMFAAITQCREIIYVHRINRLVFAMEKGCMYCEVRN